MTENGEALIGRQAAPAPMRRHSSDARVFVGRERELRELQCGLEAAEIGQGRLVLIGGEPGIGKSRLADELAERAAERGFHVLWGRCWEAGGAPAYWPWVQSIRASLRDRDVERLRAEMGPDVALLGQLLPEIHELFPDMPAAPPLDSEAARFRLFDATTRLLRRTAQDQPLLLVLDDLHAGDVPSLLLLRFLAGELAGTRLLVLGLYRHTELQAHHPVLSLLMELGRGPSTRSLLLGGLSEAEVGQFVEITTGMTPHAVVAAGIHRQSEGNALFMDEIVRLLDHEGRLGHANRDFAVGLHLPPGIRQVIGRRLRHLTEECCRVLALASVLGREFDLLPLERMSGFARPRLLAVLDEAESTRVVSGIPGTPGRMRFSHALIRDAVYEELGTARRFELHRLAGETIEEICRDDPDPHLSELAHHFGAAALDGEPGKAIAYARAAGDRAATLLAFEEAARLYRMALSGLDIQHASDPELRCEILLSLGDVELRANQIGAGCSTFLEAVEIARGLASPTYLARAALGHSGRFVWIRGASNPRIVPLLREALARLHREDSVLRARLLARLAGALRDQPNGEERNRLSREAVEIARRSEDRAALAYSLDGRFAAIWEPGNSRERLAIATELTRVAELSGDPERALQGHHYRLITLLELGELPLAYAALDAKARLATELGQPPQRWYVEVVRALLALFEGRFGEGEALMEHALSFWPEGWHSASCYRSQLFVLRREQGRLAEIEPLIRRSAAEYPGFPVFRAMLALLYTETDRPEDARSVFEALAAGDFADLPWDCEWLYGTSLLAEVACSLGDLSRAATLYRLIEPYAAFNVIAPAEVSTGSASLALGLLAAALSRWEEAERRLRDAIVMNDRMGARPWAVRARYGYARMLLARDRPGDRGEARKYLVRVTESCRDLPMPALAQQAASLLGTVETGSPGRLENRPDERSTRVRTPPVQPRVRHQVLRREGEYWSMQYEAETCRLKDTKGIRYLARLLRAPSCELHALDLVVAEAQQDEVLAHAALGPGRGGDAGVVLDAQARAEYRERLQELAASVAAAAAAGDFESASQAEQERDFLIRELARAVGLGGRDRRAASTAERARVNVTRAIKSAVRKIEHHSPSLGEHLASTVHTGMFCSYMPDPRVPIIWES